MAKHEVVIHENTSATKESAPYLGSYIAKETVAMAAFAAVVGAKCGLPPIQVMAILSGAFDAIEALEAESLVRVHTDIGVVCGVITGSFPTSDAAFDPERNALELALRLDEGLRLSLADETAKIITDADVTKVRVDSVMDVNEQKPMNLIHGKRLFRVAGFNMVLSDEGAAVFLQNSQGTTFPVTVEDVISKQLFTARMADLLEAGDYKLVVKSRGGDAEGPLQTSFRRVKYLRVEDPEPLAVARLKSTMLDVDDATWFQHHGTAEADAFNTVTGTGFGEDLAAQIVLKDSEGAAVDTVEVSDLTRVSDGEFTFKLFEPPTRPPDGDWEDGPVFLEVTSGGTTVELQVAFVNPDV